MRWIRILLIVLVVIVVAIGGAVLFVLTADLNDYKDTISAVVERATGRTLELDGRVDLELGAKTSLELTDARFGNPDWAAEPYMARLARGKLVVDVRSILDRPIIVEHIELEQAELHLESLDDGRNNWTFGTAAEDDEDSAAADDGTSGAFQLVLAHARGQDLLFTLAIPPLPRRLEIRATDLSQESGADGLLNATASGTLNDREISVSGKYGPLANLLATTNVQFDVRGKFDTLSISGNALIDDLTGPRVPEGRATVSGPSIDDVTEMLGLPDLGDGGLDLQVSVEPDADGVKVVAKGNVGEFVTDTSARASELLDFVRFSVTTDIRGPDLGGAMRIFGIEGVPGGPFDLGGTVTRDGDRLEVDEVQMNIATASFSLNGSIEDFLNLEDANLTLRVAGDDVEQFRELVGIPGAATGPFQINADLNVRADQAELLEVHMQTGIARINITGTIVGKAPDFIGTQLQFEGTGNNLADFADLYEIPNPIAEPFTIAGAIELGEHKLTSTQPVVVKVADDVVSVEGTMGYAPLERDTDIRAHASGKNLAEIAAMAGVTENVPAVPYDVKTGLAVGTAGYRINKLVARLGDGRVEFDGLISRATDFSGTRGAFAAAGPHLEQLLPDIEALDFATGPFEVSGSAELQADAVRLQQVTIEVAGADATVDADIGLPLETGSGHFDIAIKGPSLRAVVPKRPRWTPSEAPFDIRARGNLADGLWSFDELTAQLASARLHGSGVFDQPPDLSRTQLALSAQIPDLAALGSIDDNPLPSTSASFDLGFAGSPKSFSVEPFKALIGEGDFEGGLTVHLDREIPEVDLRLASNVLDIDSLLPLDPEAERELDEAVETEEEPADGRVIPDRPLQLEQLRKVNARVDIDAKTFHFRGRKNSDFMLDGEIRDGRLVIERANLITPQGSFASTLSLIPTTDSADFRFTLEGTGLYLGIGGERSAEDIALAPKVDADIELSGSGLTIRELAAGLDGTVRLQTEGGQVPNSGLRFFYGGFFQELLKAVNPFAEEEPYTTVSCAVLLLGVNDGTIDIDPGFVMQTDKMNIVARGEANLANEKLRIDFRTQPRSRVSISAGEFINPYLQVAGTMAEPKLTLDPTGTLVTGGAAVATAGLSLLATAVWDRVFREDDPCGAAIEESLKDEKTRKKFLGIF